MDIKEVHDERGQGIEIRPQTNLEGVMQAVAVALFKMTKIDRLSDDEKCDIISAGIDLVRTICADDIAHAAEPGSAPDGLVVERIMKLGIAMEEIRKRRLDRFFNLCELLKPEFDLSYKVEDADDSAKARKAYHELATADVN